MICSRILRMMFSGALLFIILIPTVGQASEPPSVSLQWTSASRDAIAVTVRGEDEFLNRCAVTGLEVRYSFTIRLCRERSFWFDRCEETRILHRSLKYDPIADGFHLASDIIGDGLPADTYAAASLDEALAFVKFIPSLSLEVLAQGEPLESFRRRYLLVDVAANCMSEYSETFSKLSSVLSLGMVGRGVMSTGAIVFRMDR